MSESPDVDGQDGAEALDETMLDDDAQLGGEARTFEELPDLLDLTQAEGDRDDDEARAIDASDFDPEMADDPDPEEDDELHYPAATGQRQDDLDGLGPEDGFDEDRLSARDIEGLDEVGDAETVEGGEDDFTNFQARTVGDADLQAMGYLSGRRRR